MKLWRKLTVDWPCALGDWLWATLVVAPAAFLDCLTYRSVFKMALRIGFFAVLLFYFQEIVSFDLTFLFYIDVTAYPEIAATLFVLLSLSPQASQGGPSAEQRVSPDLLYWVGRKRCFDSEPDRGAPAPCATMLRIRKRPMTNRLPRGVLVCTFPKRLYPFFDLACLSLRLTCLHPLDLSRP
jgi:hypothetical protein